MKTRLRYIIIMATVRWSNPDLWLIANVSSSPTIPSINIGTPAFILPDKNTVYVLNQLLISLRSFNSQFSELIAYQKSTIIDDIIRRHRESWGLQILGSDFTVTVAAGLGPGTANIFRNMLGLSEVMLFLLFRSYHLGLYVS